MKPSHTGIVLARRYRVGHPLGAGGTSIVYEGLDVSVGRPIAIKILKDGRALARFEREARLLAKLADPNIVVMSDFGNAPGEPPFIVMERLVGESLGTFLQHWNRVDPQRAARIALQVLSGLDTAHQHGVVHRDIKPDNVFLCTVAGSDPIVKLVDFGIARPLEGATLEALTQAGGLLGTVSFMAPEQVLGQPVGPRTDLYALGAMMYCMIEGRAPFEGRAVEVLTAIATQAPAPMRNADPAIAAIVGRAMERSPEARFASARQMLDALQAYLANTAPMRRERPLGVWIFVSTLSFAVGAVAIAAFAFARRGAHEEVVVDAGVSPDPPTAVVAAKATTSEPPPELTATPTAKGVTTATKTVPVTTTTKPATTSHTEWSLYHVDVTTSSLVVRGAVAESAVRRDLEWNAYNQRMCYGSAYDPTNAPAGTVTVAVDVDDDLARHARLVASDFHNPSFESCVVNAVGGVTFSHAQGAPGAVTYQMKFSVK